MSAPTTPNPAAAAGAAGQGGSSPQAVPGGAAAAASPVSPQGAGGNPSPTRGGQGGAGPPATIDSDLHALLNRPVDFLCRCEQRVCNPETKKEHLMPRVVGIYGGTFFLGQDMGNKKSKKKNAGGSPARRGADSGDAPSPGGSDSGAGGRSPRKLAIVMTCDVGSIRGVELQQRETRRFTSPLKKRKEVTVLIAKADPPDVLLTLSDDTCPTTADEAVSNLKTLLQSAYNEKTGAELPIGDAPKKKKLQKAANLTGDKSAHGNALSTPLNAPETLWFVSVSKPELTGMYSYSPSALPEEIACTAQPASTPRGGGAAAAAGGKLQPSAGRRHVWSTPVGNVIYLHKSGRWVVSDRVAAEAGEVTLCSAQLAEGRLPHQLPHGWALLTPAQQWEPQPKTQATSSKEVGGTLVEQALLGTACQHCLRVWEYYKKNCQPKSAEQLRIIKDVDTEIAELHNEFTAAFEANTDLFRPVSENSMLSEEDLQRIRTLSGKVAQIRQNVVDRVRMVESALGVQSALPADSPDSSLMKVETQPRFASLTSAVSEAAVGGGERRHPDDRLMWGHTLQSAQLTLNSDTILKLSIQVEIVTSELKVMRPAALVITDTAFYICQFVDGKVEFVASGERITRFTTFRDRRKVAITFSNKVVHFVDCWETEALLKKYILELCPNILNDSAVLDAEVSDPELRKLLKLDTEAYAGLERELQKTKDDGQRLQEALEQERKKFVDDASTIRQSAEEKFVTATQEHQVVSLEVTESAVRQSVANEEGTCFLHLLGELTESLRLESARWGKWSAKYVKGEKTSLLLASLATVEKSERLEVIAAEADARATALHSAMHPLAYSALLNIAHQREEVERHRIVDAAASDITFLTRQHLKGIVDASSVTHSEFVRISNEKISLETDLISLRERHAEIETELTAEVNKSGGLIRSNKVLAESLGSCKYIDIVRVRMDSLQLVEEVGRSRIDLESMAARQVAALKFAESCSKLSDADVELHYKSLLAHVKTASAEAEGLLGGPAKYSESAVHHLSSACRRIDAGFRRMHDAVVSKGVVSERILSAAAAGFIAKRGEYLWEEQQDYVDILEPAVYPQVEGWLYFNGNPVITPHAWKRRYFVFFNGMMQCKNPNSGRFANIFSVSGVVSVTPVEDMQDGTHSPRRSGAEGNFFMVELISPDAPPVKFSCKGGSERREWVATLREATALHSQQTGRSAPPTRPSPDIRRALKQQSAAAARSGGGGSTRGALTHASSPMESLPFPASPQYQGYVPKAEPVGEPRFDPRAEKGGRMDRPTPDRAVRERGEEEEEEEEYDGELEDGESGWGDPDRAAGEAIFRLGGGAESGPGYGYPEMGAAVGQPRDAVVAGIDTSMI